VTAPDDPPPAEYTEVVKPDARRAAAVTCPACGSTEVGQSRFCEACGQEVGAARPAAPPAGTWWAEIAADPDYYARMAPTSIGFPDEYPARSIPLERAEIRIGRRSEARGIDPTIDLGSEPLDPGISHLHAMLVRVADGPFAVVDLGSTNGTTLNDGTTPLEVGQPVPLVDGDRIHLGAWTTITIHAG
jgi:hypothetical protein